MLALSIFALAVFLAMANERIVNRLVDVVRPLVKPQHEATFAVGVQLFSWVTGGLLSWFIGVDLLTPLLAEFNVVLAYSWVGPAVTAVIVGGGSNLLHDIWPQNKPMVSGMGNYVK